MLQLQQILVLVKMAFICIWEGFAETCFWDNAQWTIGYGNKCTASGHSSNPSGHEKGPHTISQAEATTLFKDRISEYVNYVKYYVSGVEMNQNQFDALVSLCYNAGPDRLYNSSLAKYLRGEVTESEARELMSSYIIYDGSSVSQGLINRRNAEANLFFNCNISSSCNCYEDYAGDYTVNTESTNLIMRAGHGSSYSVITTIPKGSTVHVSKSDGTWAHVEYDGYTGYCSMNYLTKIEPLPVVPSKPEYLAISDCNSMTNITLSWAPCENTDYYDIRYYTADGTEIGNVGDWLDTTYIVTLPYGNYYFNVASVNNNGNYTFSDNYNFNVSKGDLVPTTIETYNNHIYALYDIPTTYDNVNLYATALGGHLATITSEEENNVIIGLKDVGSLKKYYLGATDIDNEGIWKWCTGEEFSYSNWNTGQPDNCIGIYSNENYLEIWENGYWNDITNCNSNMIGFIIEIEPLTEIKSVEYNNHTYYVFNNTLSWTEANQYAQNMDGYLVEINNQAENDFIQSLAQDCNKYGYWISLNDTGYTNFKEGEPNNTVGIENYYHMYTETGEWNDADNCQGLSHSIGFIVEVNTVSPKEIKLNKSKLALQENQSYQLELLNVDSSKDIIWVSSDTSIATVEDGLVTAISNGDVDIYAIIDNISIKCNLKIYPYQKTTLLGDCNNNGSITVIDLLLLKRYILGINVGNTINIYNSDINTDGNVNILDIIVLKQVLL